MADFPKDRRYTKDHEWAREDGGRVRVGVTQHAVDSLGDITLVNIDVAVGGTIEAGKAFGTVESVKAVSDLFAPVSGTIVEINAALQNKPELINEDCYEKGWMVLIQPTDKGALNHLLDSAAYTAHAATADH
jgi:glycine cleavage system H protein